MRSRCRGEAMRILRNRDDAEDAAQLALLRAWRGREQCRTPDDPVGWCAAIARNEALRLLSQRAARPVADADPTDRPDPAADQALSHALVRADTMRGLKHLTPGERELVVLRHYAGMSQTEIARASGLNETTVRVRMHRIHRCLRTSLAAPGETEP